MDWSGNSRTSAERGFGVLEALIALIVVTTLWVALAEIPSNAFRATSAVAQRERAVQLAQTELALSGVAWPLSERRREGTTPDGFDIVVEVSPYALATGTSNAIEGQLYHVVIDIAWNEPRSRLRGTYRLSTFRLAGDQQWSR